MTATSQRSPPTLAGLVLIGITGLAHLIETPEYFGEKRYIGILFAFSALGSLLAMIGIWKRLSPGWLLGFAVAGGSFVAYLLSRTIGLPGFHENSWSQFLEPMGILTLIVEGIFCVVAYVVLTRRSDLTKAIRVSD